jgi:hypothetical protein
MRGLKYQIANGAHAVTEAAIPWINISSDDHNIIKFFRLQFPVVPAFAITISEFKVSSCWNLFHDASPMV